MSCFREDTNRNVSRKEWKYQVFDTISNIFTTHTININMNSDKSSRPEGMNFQI